MFCKGVFKRGDKCLVHFVQTAEQLCSDCLDLPSLKIAIDQIIVQAGAAASRVSTAQTSCE